MRVNVNAGLPILHFVLSWSLISYNLPSNNNLITTALTHKLGVPNINWNFTDNN